jgi:hypothetical protein
MSRTPIIEVGDVVRNLRWQKDLDYTVRTVFPEYRSFQAESVMGGGVFSGPGNWRVKRGKAFVEFDMPKADVDLCGKPIGKTGKLCVLPVEYDEEETCWIHEGPCRPGEGQSSYVAAEARAETPQQVRQQERAERRERILTPNGLSSTEKETLYQLACKCLHPEGRRLALVLPLEGRGETQVGQWCKDCGAMYLAGQLYLAGAL